MQEMRYPFVFIAILAVSASAVPAYGAEPTPLGLVSNMPGGKERATQPRGNQFVADMPTPCVGAVLPTLITGPGHAFSWADAGVGAAAAAGALLALVGTTLIVIRRVVPIAEQTTRPHSGDLHADKRGFLSDEDEAG
jgi:hypothetical protein